MKENQFISRSLQQAKCPGCMAAHFTRKKERKGGREMYLTIKELTRTITFAKKARIR